MLFTLTERKTREEMIIKLESKEAKGVAKVLDILEKNTRKNLVINSRR